MKRIKIDTLKKFLSQDELDQLLAKYNANKGHSRSKWFPTEEDLNFGGKTIEDWKQRWGGKSEINTLRKIGLVYLAKLNK
jgi:hypothetical protein